MPDHGGDPSKLTAYEVQRYTPAVQLCRSRARFTDDPDCVAPPRSSLDRT
ncbi:hypothetical protein ACVLHI_001986 [Paenibacillus sp. PvR053]